MDWGPLTHDDAQPLADLWAAMEAEDRTGEVLGVGDVAEQLSHHLIDLAAGTLAARDDGRIAAVGYLPVRQSAEDGVHVMSLWGGVHPAYRRHGLGRRIVDWAVRTAPGLGHRAFPGVPVELQLSAHHGNPGLAALAVGAGFAPVRTFADMRRSLSDALPPLRTLPGVSIATWSPELDDGARHVRNESFRDHWGSASHTPESWAGAITGTRNFRPESSFVALAEGRVVGLLMTHFFDERSAQRGEREAWIQIIGTLKEWRGKGVAGALIAHALAAFARQGYGSAGLGVDTENPTGAVSVYGRAGFRITDRRTTYALTVVEGEPGDEARAGVHE
ncbi:GNAT family N-acetyltransferase [Nonomuraea antimicrobica]|uniref:GNAT family N-acetyltransferase n=1 Tax=Nonomuraea antimicrobica TaxID=561173 RepID=A0ABP7ENF9_9ACTN